MNTKKNSLLFGAFLVVAGVYLLVADPLDANLKNLPYMAAGTVLLLLYFCKRKTMALVFGVLMTEVSLYSMLPTQIIKITLVHVLFFFVPGTIFLTLFLTKNKQGLLIPGSFLSWLGLGMVLSASITQFSSKPLMIICFGCAFLTVYLLGNLSFVRTYLYVGVLICFFGLVSLFRAVTLQRFTSMGWVAIIILTVLLITQSRRKNHGRKR